jgi:TrmH family RNA methyltransferase
MITSPNNPRVKLAARLRDHRQRKKEQRILIDGAREISRAVAAGVALQEVFVCRELCRGDESRRLLGILPGSGAEILEVTESVFSKLAFGDRAEGIVAVAAVPAQRLENLVLPDNPLVAVLEGVEKPGNIGAVLRSADGAGVSALVLADPRTDLYNPNAIRASLGTIFTLPVAAASADEVLAWLRSQSLQIVAARVEASVEYTAIDFRRPTAIVLGSEANGLSPAWAGGDIRAVRLPMLGAADSLNVSTTAAVLFYEALRQKSGLSSAGRGGADR